MGSGKFGCISPAVSEIIICRAIWHILSMEQQANGVYGLLNKTGKTNSRKKPFISRVDEHTLRRQTDMFDLQN